MESVESRGKTVEEALQKALISLGRRREEVEVKILSEGRAGILGFGAEDARVLVTVRAPARPQAPAPPPAARPTAQAGFDEYESEDEDEEDYGEYEEEAEEELAPPRASVRRPSPAEQPHPVPTTEDEEEIADAAGTLVVDLLNHMQIPANVTLRSVLGGKEPSVHLDLSGDDLGILIGRRGETLGAIQFLVNLMLARRLGRWVRVTIDVEHYRDRREDALRAIARRAAERVRRSRQPVVLDRMIPAERRIIHLTLQDSPYVTTHSIGEGDDRRVVVSPKR